MGVYTNRYVYKCVCVCVYMHSLGLHIHTGDVDFLLKNG